MTPEEKRIWYEFLKLLPFTVKRQYTIENYIVDFYIPSHKLIIEIDGSQHDNEGNYEADVVRDRTLSEWGLRVLRYSNNQVKTEFSKVADELIRELGLEELNLKEEP